MTSWLRDVEGPLNAEQRAIVDGLASVLERAELGQLDGAASAAVADENGLHITLAHRARPELGVVVDASGHGETIVSYGHEHEHFRTEDAEMGRVWPFPSENHLEAVLTFVESLLTGRIELQVWKRPLGIKTRSYWFDDDGERQLFLRGGTVGPFWGWSRAPEVYRFDFR